MVGLGFGLGFGGYLLLTYGWSQLRGCNASFVSLAWPNSFNGCNPDPPAPANPATQTAQQPTGAAATGQTPAAAAKGSTNANQFTTSAAAKAYLGQLAAQYGSGSHLSVIKNADGTYSVVTS